MAYRIDLSARMNAAFPFVVKNLAAYAGVPLGGYWFYSGVKMLQEKSDKGNSQSDYDDAALYSDVLSAELVLKSSEVSFKFSNGDFLLGEATESVAPVPLLKVSCAKEITVTPVNDSGAVIVELYRNAQWEITMEGIVVNHTDHQRPLQALRKLRQLFELNELLEVTNDYLNNLNISHLYFTEFSCDEVEGFEDTMKFTLSGSSVQSPEYTIKNLE